MRWLIRRNPLLAIMLPALCAAQPTTPRVSEPKTLAVPTDASPDPRRLRSDVEAMIREREQASVDAKGEGDSVSAERIKLRAQLLELMRQLQKKVATPEPTTKPSATTRPKFDFPEGTKPLDALRLAQNLFRANDFDAALRAFRLIDPELLNREDRVFVQYMTACCLRRIGKLSDAAVIYREIADAKEDDFITECSLTQLSNIRTTQELEAQLEELRARRRGR